MSKRTFLGITLALIIIGAVTGALLLLAAPFARMEPASVVPPTPSVVHRSDEVPVTTHRAFSPVASTQATALLPWGIALDPLDGFTWVAEPGCEPQIKCPADLPGVLGQYALSDGSFIQTLSEPAGYSSPLFVAVDQAGDVWFTQPASNAIGEYLPQTQDWKRWPLQAGRMPFDLTFDRTGNLWFTELASNSIGFLNPHTGALVETPLPTRASQPYGIALDPRGNVWFTENGPGVDQLGSFTPTRSGAIAIREYALGTLRPHLLAADAAGKIWYSGGFGGDVGAFDPRSGTATQFSVSPGLCPTPPDCTSSHISAIALDGSGRVWFTDSLSQRVGYLVPATGQVVALTLGGSNAHPNDGLVVDSAGRVWFTEEYALTLRMLPASAL